MPTAGNPSGPITTSCGTPRDSETIWRPQRWMEPSGEITIQGEGGEEEKNLPKKEWKLYFGFFFLDGAEEDRFLT